jgi:hypothetical protein
MKQTIILGRSVEKVQEAINLIKNWIKETPKTYSNCKEEIDHLLFMLESSLKTNYFNVEEEFDMDYDVITWLNGEDSDFEMLFDNEYL